MNIRPIIFLIALHGCTLSCDSGAEEFGRLFFSAAERLPLPMESSATRAQPAKIDSPLDGIIQRSDGSQFIWRNGQLQFESTHKNLLGKRPVLIPSSSAFKFTIDPHLAGATAVTVDNKLHHEPLAK